MSSGVSGRQKENGVEWKDREKQARGKEKSSRDVQLGVTQGGLLKAQRPWGTFSLGLEAGRFAGPGRTVASRMCVDKSRQEDR